MNLSSHIESLTDKHHILEEAIRNEMLHPLPDLITLADLKKRKLKIKEEMEQCKHMLKTPERRVSSA